MSLTPGTRLGPYEITGPIGAGGMGEVYPARDTKLNRDVAIKVLPDVFAADADRLARFTREAQVLASLNHPNIAAIYGIEQHALVMELVEGEDLSAHIARGPIALSDALPIAKQIADALEAAHEHGIVHRDLKPANVKVRADGTVKVLDFGLAKAMDPAGASGAEPTNSPTMTARATQMGMVIGTAAYMAPEQARGRVVDRRADIWSFGVVLYQMLSGRRAFDGDDISITLASVLKEEVKWDALPGDLPAPLHTLLRRCLEKDPKRRLRDIGEARLAIDDLIAHPHAPVSRTVAPESSAAQTVGRGRRLAITVAAAAALVLVTAAATMWVGRPLARPPAPIQRLTIVAPEGETIVGDPANMAISPNGRMVAFLTGLTRGTERLWIRSLDTLESRLVEDSTGARFPFWSPDSQSVAFFAQGQLKAAPTAGGRAHSICPAQDGRGGAWGASGIIVFAASNAGALSRVSANGGDVTAASTLDASMGETGHRFPTFLPDGRHFLYAALPVKSSVYGIFVGTVDTTKRELLLTAESSPTYVPPGYLVFSRKGQLVAQPFNADTRTLSGEPVPSGDLPGDINFDVSAGQAASVSEQGTLAYPTTVARSMKLSWLDQTGRELQDVGVPVGPYEEVAVSPDGRRAVIGKLVPPATSLWWVDLVRGAMSPLTSPSDHAWNVRPVFSPDGQRVAYASDRFGPSDIYVQSGGPSTPTLLFKSPSLFKFTTSWSPDGKYVVFSDLNPDTSTDLWTLHVDGGGGAKAELYLRSPAGEDFGAISPDGRWMAYLSNEGGQFDAYVQSFPTPGRSNRVTTTGTSSWGVWWRSDGTQLLMLGANLEIMLSDVKASSDFSASPPRTVGRLHWPADLASVAPTPDLKRLLALVPTSSQAARSITVVTNWQPGVRR